MPAVRFMRKGITKIWFVTSISSPAAPTSTEINAGTLITPQVATINGLSWANTPIHVPDMASTFVGQIGGEDTTEDTNFELYSLKGGTDSIFAALVKGTTGFLVTAPKGTAGSTAAISDVVDVWAVTITSKAKIYTADNTAAMYRVAFALTAAPTEDYTLAA